MKKIVILGSTGSIGESALSVVRKNKDKVSVRGLSTKKNIDLLQEQIDEFRPAYVSIWDAEKADILKNKIGKSKVKVYSGMEGLLALARMDVDLVVSALVGAVGLKPALEVIKSGKNLALANKEVLVMAGEILQREAKKQKINIIPIDSEHSALMQCLWKREADEIKRLIITASGGPFYNKNIDFRKITPELALNHPTWKMGKKVTIDSATLMNKGFEVIEASYLFNIPIDKIDVVIHPESIVHAMVEFIDGSVSAFMHIPDMRVPIQYAISWPSRWNGDYGMLDLSKIGTLNFKEPDTKKFPALELAYNAGRIGGTMTSVLSAADEVCVGKFLQGEISFTDIPKIIKSVMGRHKTVKNPDIDDIIEADNWAREKVITKTKLSLTGSKTEA